ncbi:MAG: sensor domain-containing diguanylate cyclase [Candidatus Eremiobacteraeota bacterium]|nr:sensor domain-containing diguanylate cyclase [Candidatus Eremiobacteraeota bacterium]NNM93471.1 sensor domain-containing diguanylate cyclase [Candidatus Eremiobacteraeota bacterium]
MPRYAWITDNYLNVLALNEALAAQHRPNRPPSKVAELWGESATCDLISGAHRCALEGRQIRLEVEALGQVLLFELEPLRSPAGDIVGTSGRARMAEPMESPIAAPEDPLVEEIAQIGSWRYEYSARALQPSLGLLRLLGLPPTGDLGDIRAFDHPEDRALVRAAIEASGDTYEVEHRIVRHDGEQRHVRERATTIRDAHGFSVARVGTMLDITAIKLRESWLRDLANVDTLTGLGNRRLLEERLGAAIMRSERFANSCAILFIDIDDFKSVNDTYGHAVGDAYLVEFALRLARNVRASDTVTRLAGDEFVIVLEDLENERAAAEAAEKIATVLREPLAVGALKIEVRASIGLAVSPRDGENVRDLLERADLAMYEAKRRGSAGVGIGGGALLAKKVAAWSPRLIEGKVSSSKDRPRYGTQPNVSHSP